MKTFNSNYLCNFIHRMCLQQQ